MTKLDVSLETFVGNKLLLASNVLYVDPEETEIKFLLNITNFCKRWIVISFIEDDSDKIDNNYATTNDDGTIQFVFHNLSKYLAVLNGVGYEIDFAVVANNTISINIGISKDDADNRIIKTQIFQRENPKKEALSIPIEEALAPTKEDANDTN